MSFSVRFRSLRLAIKALLPYVRRRQYRQALRRQANLVASLAWQAQPASSAHIHALQPLADSFRGELCLFVSHAAHAQLKAHVQHHITHLLNAGIAVVLVINTDLPASDINIPHALLARLSGVLVRENLGFDFAAWAHAYALLPSNSEITRMYLTNDSIVGPLSEPDFLHLLTAMRTANADMVGLTQSLSPTPHLQSYFLSINCSMLHSDFFKRFFARVLNLPTKEQVIDAYETRFTEMAIAHGLSTAAVFQPLSEDRYSSNDTHYRWRELLSAGFPYVKTSVIKGHPKDPQLDALIPAPYRQSAQ